MFNENRYKTESDKGEKKINQNSLKNEFNKKENYIIHDIKNNITILKYLELFSQNSQNSYLTKNSDEFIKALKITKEEKNASGLELNKLKESFEIIRKKFLEIKQSLIEESPDEQSKQIIIQIEKTVEQTKTLIEEYINLKLNKNQ